MAWLEPHDYSANGWDAGAVASARARHYCSELEWGTILFFSRTPFALPESDLNLLLSLKTSGSPLHKNISYRAASDQLRGLATTDLHRQVHEVMRRYAAETRRFVADLLSPYAGRMQLDYASFRPIEEQGRNLPLHKRNDLLHVDAFPSRPTCGARILRVFTNINPQHGRLWVVGERFPKLAEQYAERAGLLLFRKQSRLVRGIRHGLHSLGLPVPDRAPYDRFMLHFHDWLKENSEFQKKTEGKERLEFPSRATWLVFTDGVPHAALSGQYAVEQTFIIPVDALVAPEASPVRVLERLSHRALA